MGRRDARITEDFADGTYEFCMNYGAIRMLQEAREMGPLFVYQQLQAGTWRIEDVRETIRCGLIGGGMAAVKANKMVQMYVEERPIMENVALAMRVLGAGLIGAPEEDVGEPVAADQTKTGQTAFPTVN